MGRMLRLSARPSRLRPRSRRGSGVRRHLRCRAASKRRQRYVLL